jgi:hypothetical protein
MLVDLDEDKPVRAGCQPHTRTSDFLVMYKLNVWTLDSIWPCLSLAASAGDTP